MASTEINSIWKENGNDVFFDFGKNFSKYGVAFSAAFR
jgi:hypothetical protein